MSASTNSLPNPIPQERHVDDFRHTLENIFGYGEYGKLWDALSSTGWMTKPSFAFTPS
jgi:hypothetical protein